MSVFLTAHQVRHSYGGHPLFEGLTVTVAEGDRIGLIGPNGAGKSTLFKILAGTLTPDEGTVARRAGLRVAIVQQTPAFAPEETVRAAVAAGLARAPGAAEWEGAAQVEQIMGRLDLGAPHAPPEAPVAQLSGGWQKRVALARALIGDPDLLLLDEPTNHLDIEGIGWLESFLATSSFASVVITHDRAFLQKVAARIWELDRRNEGGLLDVAGDYATYLERKEALMAAQERREESLRNTLRRETEWLRRGPAARTTKQKARIDRAHSLAANVDALSARNRTGSVQLDFEGTGKKPRRLIEARGVSKSYGSAPVFEDVDLFIGPGTRLGLLGRNGCGKSTLLRVLLGQEDPSAGQVLRADDLAVASFEQDRGSLDPARTLADTVCPDGDFVDYRGSRQHRHGYLARFRFAPEQFNQQVGKLSGGEQARILVARLMLRPANVLVLDEPTNDLDIDTLNVLEDALVGFDGAVLLVSHDRYFIDQVSTQLLAFHPDPADPEGTTHRLTAFADLAQWEDWQREQKRVEKARKGASTAPAPGATPPSRPRKKLSYKDQRDRDTIEARIEAAEATVAALAVRSADPEVASNAEKVMALQRDLDAAQAEVDRLYARWEELEALQSG